MVGIAAICVCSIVAPLAILGIREYRSPTKARDFRGGRLARLVVWLGSLPRPAAVPLTVAAVVIFGGGVLGEDDLNIESDPERWVNQDSQVIHDIETLKREVGSSSELGIFVETDDPDAIFDDETVAFVQDFARAELAERPDDLITASSVVTTVGFVLDIPGTTPLPPTGEDVRRAYEVAPPAIQQSTVNAEAGALNLVFRTGPGSLEERAAYVDEIRDQLESGEFAA